MLNNILMVNNCYHLTVNETLTRDNTIRFGDMNMGKSAYPSVVVLPDMDKPFSTVLDFLEHRFPSIKRSTWEKRIAQEKVFDESGRIITQNTPYTPGKRIHYYREVKHEPHIPFQEDIIFEDDQILVACKPHFLPVIPSGNYVNQCLLNRLKASTKNTYLTPVNRIDRETAGLVIFSTNPETRSLYHNLFQGANVDKEYEAISACAHLPQRSEWVVENRIVRGKPFFLMKTEHGIPNTRTHVYLVKSKKNKVFFNLKPMTGKKHQLRIHLSALGYGILNDRYYPKLQAEAKPDFENPLQLLSRKLAFKDPISGKKREFKSPRRLSEDW